MTSSPLSSPTKSNHTTIHRKTTARLSSNSNSNSSSNYGAGGSTSRIRETRGAGRTLLAATSISPSLSSSSLARTFLTPVNPLITGDGQKASRPISNSPSDRSDTQRSSRTTPGSGFGNPGHSGQLGKGGMQEFQLDPALFDPLPPDRLGDGDGGQVDGQDDDDVNGKRQSTPANTDRPEDAPVIDDPPGVVLEYPDEDQPTIINLNRRDPRSVTPETGIVLQYADELEPTTRNSNRKGPRPVTPTPTGETQASLSNERSLNEQTSNERNLNPLKRQNEEPEEGRKRPRPRARPSGGSLPPSQGLGEEHVPTTNTSTSIKAASSSSSSAKPTSSSKPPPEPSRSKRRKREQGSDEGEGYSSPRARKRGSVVQRNESGTGRRAARAGAAAGTGAGSGSGSGNGQGNGQKGKSRYYEGSSEEDLDLDDEDEDEEEVEEEGLVVTARPAIGMAGKKSPPRNATKMGDSGSSTTTMTAPGSSEKKARGSRANEVPAQYIHTFTTVLDYPKVLVGDAIGTGNGNAENGGRSQRQSKVDALGKIEGKELTGNGNGNGAATNALASGYPSNSTFPGLPTGISLLPPIARSSASPPPVQEPSPHNNPLLKKPLVNPSLPLNHWNIPHAGPREPPLRTKPRLFGVKECPTFYPTREEWGDPMGFVKRIGEVGGAKDWGMAKVVPPMGWRMPYVLDEETFRFQTRLQRLNSIEATSRAKLNFLDQLYMFHKQQGNSDVAIPVIAHRPVDIWALRTEVRKHGGVDEINVHKLWGTVARQLDYTQAHAPHLKAAYVKIVQPFDEFYASVKGGSVVTVVEHKAEEGLDGEKPSGDVKEMRKAASVTTSPSKRMKKDASPAVSDVKRGSSSSNRGRATGTPTGSVRSTRNGATASPNAKSLASASRAQTESEGMSDDEGDLEDADRETVGSLSRKSNNTGRQTTPSRSVKRKRVADASRADAPSSPQKRPIRNNRPRKDIQYEKGDICEVCMLGKDAAKILLCDECERGFHTYCLNPPLTSIPDTDEWYCPSCLLSTGNDYGFDEGEEHSLYSFQQRADSFKLDWFSKNPPTEDPQDQSDSATERKPNGVGSMIGNNFVTEHDVEKEFWRLVQSQYTSVEVEYGADIHSTTHGSVAPTLETHPLNPYSKDEWNLNNLPLLSLLRYIESDISGMTVPWTYIGMLFSTFCWHNEDHHTYSINYMHWGSTKTWYTVPGSSADKFEQAIRKEAPELFDQQPSLLFQLVTLLNPGRLLEMGVDVNACDQRPNEFVITWPKAYHCGFNHGFNLNEAVNFALPDWLPTGAECVANYQKFGKPPVFSHERLLISISQHDDNVDSASWLEDGLSVMIEHELKKRDDLRDREPQIGETLDQHVEAEEQYICLHCKAFCYLSQVVCQCTSQVACPEHADHLCNCPASSKTLRKRYSESQLIDIHLGVHDRAVKPQAWVERFNKAIEDTDRPSAKVLKALASEGEKVAYNIPELVNLRSFIGQINSWMYRTSTLLNRKKARSGKRASKLREDDGDVDMDDGLEGSSADSPQMHVEDMIKQLLDLADMMPFDAPEILQLRQLEKEIGEFRQDAVKLLAQPENEIDIQSCRMMFYRGDALSVDLPETDQLDRIVRRKSWHTKATDLRDEYPDFHEVGDLLDEAVRLEVPDSHADVKYFQQKHREGLAWKIRADAVVHACFNSDSKERDITLDELKDLCSLSTKVPIVKELAVKIDDLRRKTEGVKASCESLFLPPSRGSSKHITTFTKMLKAAENKAPGVIIPELERVQRVIEQYQEWMNRMGKVVGELKSPTAGIQRLHDQMLQLLDPPDDEPWAILNDVLDSVTPDATAVTKTRFNCVCRRPAQAKMYQCRKCLELYHTTCIDASYVEVEGSLFIKCPFCRGRDVDGQKPQPRPSLLKFLPLLDSRVWNIECRFRELEMVNDLLHYCNRVRDIILPKLQPEHGEPTEDTRFIRHWLRKLRDLPVNIEVTLNEQSTISLYPALLTRLKILRRTKPALPPPSLPVAVPEPTPPPFSSKPQDLPPLIPVPQDRPTLPSIPIDRPVPSPTPRERQALPIPIPSSKRPIRVAYDEASCRFEWPMFTFNQVHRKTPYVTCICTTLPDKHTPLMNCSTCRQPFHSSCMKVGLKDGKPDVKPGWNCPLCSINLDLVYFQADIFVQLPYRTWESGWFVDTRGTLEDGNLVREYHRPMPSAQPPRDTILLTISAFYPGTPTSIQKKIEQIGPIEEDIRDHPYEREGEGSRARSKPVFQEPRLKIPSDMLRDFTVSVKLPGSNEWNSSYGRSYGAPYVPRPSPPPLPPTAPHRIASVPRLEERNDATFDMMVDPPVMGRKNDLPAQESSRSNSIPAVTGVTPASRPSARSSSSALPGIAKVPPTTAPTLNRLPVPSISPGLSVPAVSVQSTSVLKPPATAAVTKPAPVKSAPTKPAPKKRSQEPKKPRLSETLEWQRGASRMTFAGPSKRKETTTKAYQPIPYTERAPDYEHERKWNGFGLGPPPPGIGNWGRSSSSSSAQSGVGSGTEVSRFHQAAQQGFKGSERPKGPPLVPAPVSWTPAPFPSLSSSGSAFSRPLATTSSTAPVHPGRATLGSNLPPIPPIRPNMGTPIDSFGRQTIIPPPRIVNSFTAKMVIPPFNPTVRLEGSSSVSGSPGPSASGTGSGNAMSSNGGRHG